MGIGASILLLAIGAILAFAMAIDPTPVAGLTIQWDTVGVILMVVGAIGLLWSLYLVARHDSVVAHDDGYVRDRERIIER